MKDFKTKNGFFTGNVGIGTTSPGKTLHIAANAHHIALEDTNGTAGSKMVGIYNNNQQLHLGRYSDDNFNDFTTDLFINSTGNVGIGTTSPTTTLNVLANHGAGDGVAFFKNESTDFGMGVKIQAGGNTDTERYALRVDDAAGNSLLFCQSKTGKVGIGTTSPIAELDVYGFGKLIGITSTHADTTRITHASLQADTNGWGSINAYNNVGNPIVRLNSNGDSYLNGGKVGIGVANPQGKLHIFDTTAGNGDLSALVLSNYDYGIGETGQSVSIEGRVKNDGGGDNGISKIVFGKDSDFSSVNERDGNISFHTMFGDSGTAVFQERMRISSSGNVGIGTTNPTAPLHITNSSNHFIKFGYGGNHGEHQIRWDSATAQLHANHNQVSTESSRRIVLGVDADEKMSILHNGNVGIGTTNPQNKLTVQSDSISNTLTEAVSIIGGNYTNSTNAESFKFFHQTQASNTNRGVAFKSIDGSLTIQTIVTSDNSSFANNISLQPNAGNVGIGTTNPGAQRLFVQAGTQEFVQQIRNNNTSSAYGLYVQFDTAHDNKISEYIRCSTNGNNNINFRVYSDGTIFADGASLGSDDRIKHNEEKIVNAVETLSKITPKKYFKTTKLYEANHDFDLDSDGNPIDESGEPVKHRVEAGVIAQEVLGVDELKFAVSPETKDEDGNITTPYALNYNSLFTYAIAAIQEQQTIIEDLKARIETLES